MATPCDESAIRSLAYQMWEESGRPDGQAEQHWLEAERKLKSRAMDEAAKESFPASDPPASHVPDNPPANAKDKWVAAAANPGQSVAPVPAPVREVNPRLENAHARAKVKAQSNSSDV